MREKSIFSADHKKVVQAIRKARVEADLSQKELAQKLKRTQSYISKIESAQIRLDVVQLKQIARGLGVKIQDLIS